MDNLLATFGPLMITMLVLGLVFFAVTTAFWVMMLADAIKNPSPKRGAWIAAMVILGIFASVPYYFLVKRKRIAASTVGGGEMLGPTTSKLFVEYYAAAVLFLLGGFVITAFAALWPIINDIKETNAQAESVLQQAANEQAYLGSLDTSIAAAQGIPGLVLDRVSQALPSQADVPMLLLQFSAAAGRNDVRINSLSFGEPKAAPKPQPGTPATSTQALAIPMDINVGISAQRYFDVKRFLVDLESNVRIMDVSALSTGGISETGEGVYALQIRTYVYPSTATRTTLPPTP